MEADEHDLKTCCYRWTTITTNVGSKIRTKTALKARNCLFHVNPLPILVQCQSSVPCGHKDADELGIWDEVSKIRERYLHSQPPVSFRMKYPPKILNNPEVSMLQYQDTFDRRKDGWHSSEYKDGSDQSRIKASSIKWQFSLG